MLATWPDSVNVYIRYSGVFIQRKLSYVALLMLILMCNVVWKTHQVSDGERIRL